MYTTDSDWREWAKTDPYFAILSNEKFKGGASKGEFLATGEAAVEEVVVRLQRAFGPLSFDRALDFGCGVGRLTMPLARRFRSAVGVDISPQMLAEARANCGKFGINNADFVISDDGLTNAAGQFDFMLSLITLQHMPVRRGLKVIESMLRRLVRGGGIYIEVPISSPRPHGLRELMYWMAWLRHRVLHSRPPMQMNVYPIPHIIQQFHDFGIDHMILCRANHFGPVVAGIGGLKT
jgi:SAM-dependent methyltransferase